MFKSLEAKNVGTLRALDQIDAELINMIKIMNGGPYESDRLVFVYDLIADNLQRNGINLLELLSDDCLRDKYFKLLKHLKTTVPANYVKIASDFTEVAKVISRRFTPVEWFVFLADIESAHKKKQHSEDFTQIWNDVKTNVSTHETIRQLPTYHSGSLFSTAWKPIDSSMVDKSDLLAYMNSVDLVRSEYMDEIAREIMDSVTNKISNMTRGQRNFPTYV
jgi:hypothetical protein